MASPCVDRRDGVRYPTHEYLWETAPTVPVDDAAGGCPRPSFPPERNPTRNERSEPTVGPTRAFRGRGVPLAPLRSPSVSQRPDVVIGSRRRSMPASPSASLARITRLL